MDHLRDLIQALAIVGSDRLRRLRANIDVDRMSAQQKVELADEIVCVRPSHLDPALPVRQAVLSGVQR